MNLFFFSHNPVECAEQHCSKHVIKMILEYAQILCTAHRVLGCSAELDQVLMKKTHMNHPVNVWVRMSSANYMYLYELFVALSFEYEWRYGKDHATYLRLGDILEEPPKNIPNAPFTAPVQCMPDEYKVPGDAIQAYRNFYIHDKARFAKWTGRVRNRKVPDWFISATQTS